MMDIVLTRILECMGNKYGSGKDLADFLGISGYMPADTMKKDI